MNPVRPSGLQPSKVLIVGEAPGAEEERVGLPFMGASGNELTKMLAEAGLHRSSCRVTNVCNERPPDNDISHFFDGDHGQGPKEPIRQGLVDLWDEIEKTKPNLIIALGNTPLWALTGKWGITNWRGSMLEVSPNAPLYNERSLLRQPKVLPTYHPSAILRQWEWRTTALHDLRRAAFYAQDGKEWPVPKVDFSTNPTFEEVRDFVEGQRGKLTTLDIETTNRHVSLVGLGASATRAMCVPLMCHKGNYWDADTEWRVVELLRNLLENSPIVGQNLAYDTQYMLRQLGIHVKVAGDTLFAQHVCFPGQPKDLAYLRSMYCAYNLYWKDDLRDYKALPLDENKFRTYNCTDAVVTYEVYENLMKVVDRMKLKDQYQFLVDLFGPVFSMMTRGVHIDQARKAALVKTLKTSAEGYEKFFEDVIGERVGCVKGSKWYKSPKQIGTLFFDEMKLPEIRHRKTQARTTDDEALKKLRNNNSLIGLLCDRLTEYRSIEVYNDTFATAAVDHDSRMRCSYNVGGTETFRFSSSKNVFGGGTNLQNVPTWDGPSSLLPNIRAMFSPTPGHVLLDWDLDRADLQVVVWEADDTLLKRALRSGIDMHLANAAILFKLGYTEDELADPARVDVLKKKYGRERQVAKMFVHGTNYGGSARTMAINCGVSVQAAEMSQARWFAAHPGIKLWHNRVKTDLLTLRRVRNKFGFHRVYFDRVDGLLSEALAWIPQSTVAITINKGLLNIHRNLPWVRLLLQVHDSIVMEIPAALFDPAHIALIREQLTLPIPYPDPLVIPLGCKYSLSSWGEVQPLATAP